MSATAGSQARPRENDEMFLWEIAENAAAGTASATALVDGGTRLDFSALAALSRRIAATVASLIEPGECVAIVSDNSAVYVAALYGVPLGGGVLVHGNTRHTPEELAALLQRCDATLLLADERQLARLENVSTPALRNTVAFDAIPTDAVALDAIPTDAVALDAIPTDAVALDAIPGGTVDPHTRQSRSDTDLAWLMYTSGSTGIPKGVMLTHRSLLSAVLNTSLSRPVAPDEVYLFPFPLFHVAAYNVLHHHLRRRPVVLLARFEPEAVMDAVEREGITSVSMAPTMLAMILEHPRRDAYDLSTLRNVSYGAAAMPRELLERVTREWPGVGLSQGYGMTELSGNAVFLSPEDHRRAASDRPELLTAAGRPGPMAALRIVDRDGQDVDPECRGEILVRGDQVCAGYHRDPGATDAAWDQGWFHTGDVGRIDDLGYLHVVDRLKDIIITGGENVSSREVEDAIGGHPLVRRVAVLGSPDERWGELVTAVVVPTDPAAPPTLDGIREACAGLAGFKHPRELVLVDDLPTNASGKVDKPALRSQLGTRSG